ncbi:hypothetical protein [Moorena sp. SIO3H5]|uniref:hypothetical protein n=1 Tax=Moorena sp. SIO3H5 TaxID=2607834 RepID=UPI0013BBB9C9|nr:hypothetical protein [Moorena sp. SIO3H5]NEO72513.1 hypothetical protein [Moorena sp. SIO3H5]
MANIKISDLAISPVSESFITELDEHNINGIIGGDKIKIKYYPDGTIKKIVIKKCRGSSIQ